MIEPGTLLQNRYRVVKQIGQGGMGAVYFATDERFNSAVAVKQTFFDDPALRKAFEREAHLLNHLRHTALPKVSDHFTEGDGQFLVMEYIEGSDISALQQQRAGAFPLADVLRWADELLDALDYLHTHEPPVVHRDIKPQNLKLTSRGQIVLLDFGLAKGTSSQARAHVTASVFGYSRSYAPLEQIQGTGTNARSDLYSLGATLYHLLTGAAPVDALTRASAIVNGQPDPLRPAHLAHVQVPVAISEIIRRSMAQNAAHRHSTAAEMRAVLRRASKALPHHALPVAVDAPGQSALDIVTVLESTPQVTSGQQAHTDMLSLTRVRPQLAGSNGETTLVDAFGGLRRRPSTMTAVSPQQIDSAHKSPAKLIGVALAVLVACALVAFPLMRRRGETRPGNVEAHTEATSGAPVDAGSAAPDTSQSQAGGETSNSSSAAEATPSPTPSPVAVGEAPTSNGQPATGNAATTSGSDLKHGGNADESKSSPLPVGATAGSSGLVVQSPTSNAQSGNHSAAAEYDAQRAEALRKKKEQQEQELRQRRLDEQNQYSEPAQHYELERRGPPPPPPGGGEPRPPPFRPPL